MGDLPTIGDLPDVGDIGGGGGFTAFTDGSGDFFTDDGSLIDGSGGFTSDYTALLTGGGGFTGEYFDPGPSILSKYPDEVPGDESSTLGLPEQWDVYFALAAIAQALASAARAALSGLFGADVTGTGGGAAVSELANALRFTDVTARHMAEEGRQVPLQTLADAILSGQRMPDPQGAPGAVKIVQDVAVNGKNYVLEIIYRESDKTILHFLYE